MIPLLATVRDAHRHMRDQRLQALALGDVVATWTSRGKRLQSPIPTPADIHESIGCVRVLVAELDTVATPPGSLLGTECASAVITGRTLESALLRLYAVTGGKVGVA